MARYLSRPIYLALASISLCGCGESGRWDRYAGGGSFIGARPSMSPDGSLIVYSSPATGHGDIYRINADGSHRGRLTSDPNYEGSPMFSFDGARICFMREENGVGHIWIMDRDGKNQKQLTKARESDEDPSFSREGKRIVFSRRNRDPLLGSSGSIAELYLINTDGSGEKKLTNDSTADWEPGFTPDDRGVVFSVWSADIYVLPLDTKKAILIERGRLRAWGETPIRSSFSAGCMDAGSICMIDHGKRHEPSTRASTTYRILRSSGTIVRCCSWKSHPRMGPAEYAWLTWVMARRRSSPTLVQNEIGPESVKSEL